MLEEQNITNNDNNGAQQIENEMQKEEDEVE